MRLHPGVGPSHDIGGRTPLFPPDAIPDALRNLPMTGSNAVSLANRTGIDLPPDLHLDWRVPILAIPILLLLKSARTALKCNQDTHWSALHA